ncbi:hypothetical protein E3P99_01341 [Wallemia hederae]|uniref:C3H1-type domain-containing protein n=1 Tax=Wallemia hederae TaxID=1540922 RepID=A0A4V4LTV5_9BASI|nr:hypothetical protein E3P99_01341 [Wallemia hederae]
MSEDRSYFDQILETNSEFLKWAKQEAIVYPPDQSESVSRYIERRLVERNWPSEIEQILDLIRRESNSNGQYCSPLRCQRLSSPNSYVLSIANSTRSNADTSFSSSPNPPSFADSQTQLSREDQEFFAIKAKVQSSIKQLPNEPIQIAKTIISCINNAEFEADAAIRVLALEAAKQAGVDTDTENTYISVWSVDKRAVELLAAWFKDACSSRVSEIKEWRSTHLPILLFLNKINFDVEKLKKYNFQSLVKQLSASSDTRMPQILNVRRMSLTCTTDVADAAKTLEQKWEQQVIDAETPAPRASRSSSKRSSSESGSDTASKKSKVDTAPSTTLTAKSTMSKLPSFKKAPKVQEIPAVPTSSAPADGKIPTANASTKPANAPQGNKAPAATNKQNPFTDLLGMMSQENQKKRPAPATQQSRPPPAQREQEKRQAEAAAAAASTSSKSSGKKKKSVRWLPDDKLVATRHFTPDESEQAVSEADLIYALTNNQRQFHEDDNDHEHSSDVRQLDQDEGAMLRKHITTEEEDQPQEYAQSHHSHAPHRTSAHKPKSQRQTKELRQWLEPFICHQNVDNMLQRGSESSEKEVQEQREATTIMATYLTDDQIPLTPIEPKKVLESYNDESKTIIMKKSDVVDVPGSQSTQYNNSVPGTQLGSGHGPGLQTHTIQPAQHDLINQIMASNPNPSAMQNFTAYELPPRSSAFYQPADAERGRERDERRERERGDRERERERQWRDRDRDRERERERERGRDYGSGRSSSYDRQSSYDRSSSSSYAGPHNNYNRPPKYECKFWKAGKCNKGDRCTFKHSA